MNPKGRRKRELNEECQPDDDEADDHDYEHRRTVAGIDEGIVEPAHLAPRSNAEKAGK